MLTAQLFDTKDFQVCSKVARKGAQNVKAKSQGNDVRAFATCLSVGTLPDSHRCFLFFFALMSTVHYRIEGSGAMYLSRSEEWLGRGPAYAMYEVPKTRRGYLSVDLKGLDSL